MHLYFYCCYPPIKYKYKSYISISQILAANVVI